MKTKLTLIGTMAVACAAIQLTAMPTEEETMRAEPVVKKLLASERAALESGKKTRSEVAAAAMNLAKQADTDAAKLLLMKGAFVLYVKDGNLEKAVETMSALEAAISDMPPQSITNMIETALIGVPKRDVGARLYKLLDETKSDIASHCESNVAPSSGEDRSSVASILKGMIKVPGRDYWLSATELTQGQWESVMGYNLSEHKGVNLPVDNVSRDDCDVFLEKLNQTEEVKSAQFEFRLPELEEWKYAAWAGSEGHGSWIKPGVVGDVLDMAWVKENSLNQTHVVATKAPNAFGFYDMLGNVWEWLSSPGGDAPAGRGSLKGCAFNQVADKCTWKANWHIPKTQRYYGVGMRLAAQIRHWPILRRAGAGRPGEGPDEGKVAYVNVGGYEWPFFVRNGEATIASEKSSWAVLSAPTGDISIPATLCGVKVTSIGREAFKNCIGLKSVTIPKSVKIIECEAFRNCKELTAVTIPESVTHIEASAFADSGLTSVTLPSGLKILGQGIFGRCVGLRAVAIPEGVQSIGSDAFNGCRELENIVIPDSVTSIGECAFLGCRRLMSVTIPAKVASIGEGVFGLCSGLKQINVADGNQAFTLVDGVLYSKNMSVLLACPGSKTSVTIPTGVTRIGFYAFGGCKGLKSVTIPQGVKGIGDCAFKGCNTLTSVTIPSGVTRILQWTFEGCSALESVKIQGNVTHFGHQAFLNCHELTSFTMCGERPEAPDDIFQGCGKLRSIHVPANAKSWAGMKDWLGIPLVFDTDKAGTNSSEISHVSTAKDMTGPYGIRMQPDPGCEKGAEYVLERLVKDYLPVAARYYGDPFGGKAPSRVFMVKVKRDGGTGPSWGGRGDGSDQFTVGLAKGSDKWDFGLSFIADRILTVCQEDVGFSLYVNNFIESEVNGVDPVHEIKEKIRRGLAKDGDANTDRRLKVWREFAPLWSALEELRERHPTFILDYCNLKNSRYAEGKLSAQLSQSQMLELLGEVTGENVPELFKKYGVKVIAPRQEGKVSVSKLLEGCDFLLNKDFKRNAKVYLCLFSASWCGPCRAEMPRIAKTYAESLKDDPDIELIHFSRDQDDEKALAWAKEHDVKFPVVKPNGGNPLNFQPRGIPRLYIVKQDGTVDDEGDPMAVFNIAKIFNALAKSGEESVDGYTWSYWVRGGEAMIAPLKGKYGAVSPRPQGHVNIPAKLGNVRVTSIGARAFSLSRGLTSVTIPEGVTRIENHAFSGCSGLSKVSFPTSLTAIDDQAFSECTALGSLAIPPHLKTIGSMAFWHCSNLESVTIPSGVTSIGSIAFSGCKKLRSVTIPATVTDLGHGAFSECSELKGVDVETGNGKYESVDGVLYTKGKNALVTCPGGVNSVQVPASVNSIWRYAFQGCDKLEKIVVAEDNQAYASVDGFLLTKDRKTLVASPGALTDLKLPSSLTRIESEACAANENLTSVEIPDGVVSIGRWAFNGCSRLKSVQIPTSVVTMESGVFERCPELTTITIPANVRHLGGWTFEGCKGLRSVTLSEGLENIGDYEFWSCTGLTSVVIPASVKRIGRHAFIGCWGLTSLTMSGERPNAPNNIFQDCDKLKSIHVPANAKSWAGMKDWLGIPLAFDAELKADDSRNGVQDEEEKRKREAAREEQRRELAALMAQKEKRAKAIEERQRTELAAAQQQQATVDAPTQELSVAAKKLQGCDFLLNKDFKKNAKYYLCLFSASWCPPCRAEMPRIAKTYAESLKDDPNVELIHFSRDQNDEKALAWAKEHDVKFPVVKPNGGNPLDLHTRGIPHLFIVKADGTLVEEGHPMKLFTDAKLRSIKTANDGNEVKGKAKMTSSGKETIDGVEWAYIIIDGQAQLDYVSSSNVTGSITIPSTLGGCPVTSIRGRRQCQRGVFEKCCKLTSVTIPSGVTSIGDNAFYYCVGLASVTIPNDVTNIGAGAFSECRGLESVTIGNGVTNIGKAAFCGCGGLTSVTIPDSVTSLGDWAFFACTNITCVTIGSSMTNIGAHAFHCCRGLTGITIPDGVTSIGDGAFFLCSCLTNVTIGGSVTRIGEDAFSGCSSLTSVSIPDSVTSIGNYGFSGCRGLTSVTVGNSVTNIGERAFAMCRGLTSVTIPESVTKIDKCAFYGCGELAEVTMLGERPEAPNNIFMGCGKLKSIHVPANAKSWEGMKEWQGIPLVFDAK